MKIFVISFCFILPLLGCAQDTIPQMEFRDYENRLHRIYIDTNTTTRFGDKRNKIFFLTKDDGWQEIQLYLYCPPCNIEITSCVYRDDNMLSIKTIIVCTEVTRYFTYKENLWEEIQAPE